LILILQKSVILHLFGPFILIELADIDKVSLSEQRCLSFLILAQSFILKVSADFVMDLKSHLPLTLLDYFFVQVLVDCLITFQ
jgi:hypothetical protein